jgi:hypothetical protein
MVFWRSGNKADASRELKYFDEIRDAASRFRRGKRVLLGDKRFGWAMEVCKYSEKAINKDENRR